MNGISSPSTNVSAAREQPVRRRGGEGEAAAREQRQHEQRDRGQR